MSHADAVSFLGVLWQAVAASVGLSVAVVVFALQSVATSRSATLQELVQRSGLLLVVYFGVAALLLVGVALLPLGHEGASAWPGLLATIVSGLAIASVGWVFSGALRLLDSSYLQQRRLNELRRQVRARVRLIAAGRIADQYLREELAGHTRVEYSRWKYYSDNSLSQVALERQGVIADLRLRRLRQLGCSEKARGHAPPTLIVGYRSSVDPLSPVMLHAPIVAALRCRFRGCMTRRWPRFAPPSPSTMSRPGLRRRRYF
jgi:hypothetical protein